MARIHTEFLEQDEMAEGAIFLNSGPLLNGASLESLEDTPEWNEDEAAQVAFEQIRKAFEKRATRLAGNPSVEETRFYMINPALHAMGFTHSVYEPVELGDGTGRVDYVCFANSGDFYEADAAGHGSAGFFRPAVNIVKAVRWGSAFEGGTQAEEGAPEEGEAEEGVEAAPAAEVLDIEPGAELDVFLRTTGTEYGILTNGCDWRLYHRATSSLRTTYFEADMIAAIKSDFEDFKRFYLLFRKEAFVKGDDGTSFLDRLLQ